MDRLNQNYNHLSIETKTKIITMRLYSTATFDQIANDCRCSVNIYFASIYYSAIIHCHFVFS